MPKKKDKIETLFDLLTDSMIEKLRSGDFSASDMREIREFLKQNNYSATEAHNGLKGLSESLGDFSAEDFVQ